MNQPTRVDLVLTLLFGWTGYWRFKNGQKVLGFVWLFTFGLLCIGWLIDLITVVTSMPDFHSSPYQKPPSEYEIQKQREEQAKQEQHTAFLSDLENIRKMPIVSEKSDLKRNFVKDFEFKDKNLTKKTSLNKLSAGFVAIDTETTGLKAASERIIEVSAIKFVGFVPVEHFTTLINPKKQIPSEASAINHITDDMVSDSPEFSEIACQLNEFIGKLPIVAHNAEFDCKFLFVSGLTEITKRDVYDTYLITRRVIENDYREKLVNYKLPSCCERFHVWIPEGHRASVDCYACGRLFVELILDRNEIFGSAARDDFFNFYSQEQD